jgi:hypothetical protein
MDFRKKTTVFQDGAESRGETGETGERLWRRCGKGARAGTVAGEHPSAEECGSVSMSVNRLRPKPPDPKRNDVKVSGNSAAG